MTRKFIFDSDSRGLGGLIARLEVEVSIVATAEDDSYAEINLIQDLERGEFIDLSSLPERERSLIEQYADELAVEHGHEAWLERGIMLGEAAYDAWKDRTDEGSES